MDFKQIQELIKIIGKSDLTEISIEQDNFKITLKKGVNPEVLHQAALRAAANESATAQVAPAAIGTSASNAVTQEKAGSDDKFITIKSPMVGTFYRSSSPDKEPFVKVGDLIRKGDHICIIEAMKLFNEIESEFDGKVIKVLSEDSTPVEYEQPLFLIDPNGV